MRASITTLTGIPESLLAQKPELDRHGLVKMNDSPNVYPFKLYNDDGDLIGATWMYHGEIYNQIYVDTLIIDKDHRNLKTLREAILTSFELARVVAVEVGATDVTTAVKAPRFFRRMFPNGRPAATLFKMEVDKCPSYSQLSA
jgi:hypothetical protein